LVQGIGLTLCSDGGAKNGKGSFGITCRIDNITVLECYNRVPAVYEDINCHRSECLGIMITIKIIELIEEYFTKKINKPLGPLKIRILCDNESAVKTINKLKGRELTLKNQYGANMDIIRSLLYSITILIKKRVYINIMHVKGHQDKHKKANFTEEEQLNIQADRLATIGLTKRDTKDTQFHEERVKLFINNKKVTSHYTMQLRDCFHSIKMHEFYRDKYDWSDNTIEGIWWEVHGKALKELSEGQRTIIQKYIHDRLVNNYRESKYYEYRSAYCYSCRDHIEDNDHILQCKKCTNRETLRNNYLEKIKKIMITMGTHTTTIDVIITHLRTWLYQLPKPNIDEIAPHASVYLKQKVIEQETIG
jgi:hypothetical protein